MLLQALCERRWFGLARQRRPGVVVEFRDGHGRRVGEAASGPDGIARLEIQAPGTYEAGGSRGRAFRFKKNDPILACDLDRTVSDGSPLEFWLRPLESLQPFPGAVAALNRLAERYRILYLTARRDFVLQKSRDWLDLHAFPPGPVLCREWSLTPISPEAFKRAALSALAPRFSLAAGIGDRAHDARAYLAHGMKAVLFRCSELAPAGALACDSWDQATALL